MKMIPRVLSNVPVLMCRKVFRNVPVFVVLALAVAAAGPATARASDLFLKDEPEIYAAIDKLNAMGYLPGFLANTRRIPSRRCVTPRKPPPGPSRGSTRNFYAG
jgi:hypothetical protein